LAKAPLVLPVNLFYRPSMRFSVKIYGTGQSQQNLPKSCFAMFWGFILPLNWG
jgi:hypothetical protein